MNNAVVCAGCLDATRWAFFSYDQEHWYCEACWRTWAPVVITALIKANEPLPVIRPKLVAKNA